VTGADEARRVAGAAAAELDLLLADLATWIDEDTPSGDAAANDRLAAMLAARLEEYGLRAQLVPGGEWGLYLHAALEGAGRGRVALLCHHDTIFPAETARQRGYRVEGGRAYGPGVADMKGGIAVAAHVARLLAQGVRPFAEVLLVSAPDEEIRTTGPATLERLDGFDAVLCMECGRVDGSIVSARKGARWVRVDAVGRPAHAGVAPESGANAILALCRAAVRLGALDGVQLTEFHGGDFLNTVPGSATLTLDIRADTSAELDRIVGRVSQTAGDEGVRLTVTDLGGPPPLERTPAVAALAVAAIALGAALDSPFGETSTGGVSDGSWAASCGIPTLDGLGPVGGLDHTPNEYVELDSIAARCGVVAGLVAAVDAGLLA
jgi:glutamate carboxypeptidase